MVEKENELLKENAKLRAQVQALKARKKFGLTFEFNPDDAVDAVSVSIPVIVGRDHGNVEAPSGGVVHELIKGDNFQALTAMLPTYKGKVGVIYIDPPYNTGNKDFIYDDRFVDGTDRFRHSKWLSFMKPRIELAREMLTDDGVIFVSIDDNEQAHLKMLMDEIFGEGNFVGDVVRKTKSTTNDSKNGFNIQHEYLVVYGKSDRVKFSGKEKDLSRYTNPDNDPLGAWVVGDPSAKSGSQDSWFPVVNPYTGKEDYPPKGRFWAFSKNTIQRHIDNGTIVFKNEVGKGRGFIYKRHLSQLKSTKTIFSSLDTIGNEYMNQAATKESLNVIGDIFTYPKGIAFLKHVLSFVPDDALVLDFFAGSGTTLQAVAELNAEDGGTRKCILVTSSGKPDETGVDIADDVTYERCRRVLTGKDWADGCDHPRLEQGLKVSDVVLVSTLDTLETPPVDLVDSDVIEDVVDVADMSQKEAKSAVREWKRVRGNVRRWERGE